MNFMGFQLIPSNKYKALRLAVTTFQFRYDVIQWKAFPLQNYSHGKVMYFDIHDVFVVTVLPTMRKIRHNDVTDLQHTVA